jgi:HEAT repeat protein
VTLLFSILAGLLAGGQEAPRKPADWIEQLGDVSLERREAAEEAVLEAGTESIAGLEAAVRLGNLERKERAIRLLQLLRQGETWASDLKSLPLDRRRTLIETVRKASESSGHPPKRASRRADLIPVLASALQDEDVEIRTQAVCALAYMFHPKALPALGTALGDRHPTVVYYACMGLE